MPVMDGYQATAAIRAREAGHARHLPVVALTANAMEGDRDECIAAGMDDYLAKPYSRQQLQAVLARWLRPVAVRAASEAVSAPMPGSKQESGEHDIASINMEAIEQLRALDPDGGMALAREIMQIYLGSSGKLLAQAEQAIAAADAESLRFAAHSLKSSAAYVGADRLSDLLLQLERCAREGKMCEAGPLFETAQREYEHSKRQIGTLLEQIR